MTMTYDGTNGITFPDSSLQKTAGYSPFRNRIINGDMRIDQRNSGASVALGAYNSYPVDRMACFASVGTVTAQQSSLAPAGFSNSLVLTVSSAGTVGTNDRVSGAHFIEGFNISDLGWGTVNASSVTLSFWVRCSSTGTFGGALRNNASDRSYPFTYTINSANTWEQKSITVAGDTTGTWLTNNSVGIRIFWSLGAGSTYQGTAGAWSGGAYATASGATSIVGTNGATFYITGVQLEKGSVATPFEYRPYGTELALCQRYFEKSFDQSVAAGTTSTAGTLELYGSSDSAGNIVLGTQYKVEKRTSPTLVFYNDLTGAATWGWNRSGASGTAAPTPYRNSTGRLSAYVGTGANWIACYASGQWTASAEL